MLPCSSLVARGMFRAELQQCASGVTVYLSYILSLEQKYNAKSRAPFRHNSVTESQNSYVGKKTLEIVRFCPSYHSSKDGQLELCTAGFEYLQEWRLEHLSAQPVSVWPFLILFLSVLLCFVFYLTRMSCLSFCTHFFCHLVTGYDWAKTGSMFFTQFQKAFIQSGKICLSFLFSRLNEFRSQTHASGRWSSPLNIFVALCWFCFSSSMSMTLWFFVSPEVLKTPKMDKTLQCAVQRGRISSLYLTCDCLSNKVQDAICLLCHRITSLGHGQHADYQYPKVLLEKKQKPLQKLFSESACSMYCLWGYLSPPQDLAFPFT